MAREGHVLTRGEHWVVERWLTLPAEASSLYARLHGRQGGVFRLDKLSYTEVPDPGTAGAQLVSAGLARPRTQISLVRLVDCHTVSELKRACRALGLSAAGNRQNLVDRLCEPRARRHLPGRCIQLRHRELFRRLLRIHLGTHRGDMSRIVMDAIGVQRFASYTPTGGPTLFADRRSLSAYESALGTLDDERTEEEWSDIAPVVLSALESTPVQPLTRRKFCAHRIYDRAARRAVRAVERVSGPAAALPLYRRLLSAKTERPKAVRLRIAMCLGKTGAAAQGAQICAEARGSAVCVPEDLALERTGARLARTSAQDWAPLPTLDAAPERRWTLPLVSRHPPRFLSSEGPLPVEAAVVAQLQAQGRLALHGESAPWTTLFSLLFHSALFAPIPGMLPSPMMAAPLDLRTTGFATRRPAIVAETLSRIRAGDAPQMILEVARIHLGEAIDGVHWGLLSVGELCSLAAEIGAAGLGRMMHHFVQDPRRAWSGMPDLLILPGQSPGLPSGLLLAEIKSPGDQLRDNQRCWHHELLQAGLPVEVWRVEDGPAS
jgi:hypothetical protein